MATWLFALVVLLGASLRAAESTGAWAHYFPDRQVAPTDDAGWAELAKAFPNRIKRAPVDAGEATLQSPPATRTEVHPGIDYVRVRQLASDLATITSALERPRLIIDLRYVRSGLDEALEFGALLARRPVALAARATPVEPKQIRAPGQITICLINRATSGPLEAMLDALQTAGDVMLVGTQSAGDTGSFLPVATAPRWRVIADDYRRANGTSLLDVGVTPALFVETVPEAEDAAYLAFDAGRPLVELLDAPVQKARFDEARLQEHFNVARPNNGAPHPAPTPVASSPSEDDEALTEVESPAKPEAPAAGPAPFDRSLQRAVSTLIAHDVLRGAHSAGPKD